MVQTHQVSGVYVCVCERGCVHMESRDKGVVRWTDIKREAHSGTKMSGKDGTQLSVETCSTMQTFFFQLQSKLCEFTIKITQTETVKAECFKRKSI